jgi:hypothetical protein
VLYGTGLRRSGTTRASGPARCSVEPPRRAVRAGVLGDLAATAVITVIAVSLSWSPGWASLILRRGLAGRRALNAALLLP